MKQKKKDKTEKEDEFNTITIPNDVYQANILYMSYNKVRRITYLFCLNVVNVTSRYKASMLIGAISVRDRQDILTLKTIAWSLEKIYNNQHSGLSYVVT